MNVEDFHIGDAVCITDADVHRKQYIGKSGVVIENPNPSNGCVRVRVIYFGEVDLKPQWLKIVHACKSNYSRHFRQITDEMVRTYEAKNADYGDCYADGFKRFGAVQLVSRMYEKFCRVEHLLCHKSNAKVKDESVIDTLTDLANQAIILRMIIENNDFENRE